ncbi:nuclear polyadenylated RNA-binding protein nab2 [Botrytis cinerea]
MSVEVVLDSPLAHALNASIQPKLVEVGWSTGGADDSALSEYIILMLVNGKTQEQIAAELSGDLLNLGDDDPGARDFSQWLFNQVGLLNSQISGGGYPETGAETEQAQFGESNVSQDADMNDASEAGDINVPTGPKSMRNGSGGVSRPRDKRMLNHLTKAMDRTHDAALHRVRPQSGNERINTHARGPPTGPRGPVNIRGTARMQNGRGHAIEIDGANVHSAAATNDATRGNGMGSGFPGQGRPLHERMQHPNRSQNNNFQKRHEHQPQSQNDNSMDVEMNSSDKVDSLSPDTTCRFNLSCTNKDCKFAHQSPAAPPGTAIDVADVCTFGAACKNRKCVGRHPSPAQKIAHQTTQDCIYFPNCKNTNCPFRHPTMPLCRNGADCTTPDCKFTHVKTMCKFNPCLNPTCAFKHEEGQKRGKFDDKVWVADGSKEHVSERKFVDEDGNEELILPGGAASADTGAGRSGDAEVAE